MGAWMVVRIPWGGLCVVRGGVRVRVCILLRLLYEIVRNMEDAEHGGALGEEDVR